MHGPEFVMKLILPQPEDQQVFIRAPLGEGMEKSSWGVKELLAMREDSRISCLGFKETILFPRQPELPVICPEGPVLCA